MSPERKIEISQMPPNPHNIDFEAMFRRDLEAARPRPMYTPKSSYPTHSLNYDWTGWLSDEAPFPATTQSAINQCRALWQNEHLTLTEINLTKTSLQLCLTAPPQMSPITFASRIKGRLQHALRQLGTPVKFSKKKSVRTLGENIGSTVEAYLLKQVAKERFADPRFAKRMSEFTIENSEVDLSKPAGSSGGRYWYNLHVVLVTNGRARLVDYGKLGEIRDSVIKIATKKNFRLKSVAVMPDHLHIALGADIKLSPEDTALCFMNNLAFMMGRNLIWEEKYYVGTFSDYNMNTIRH